MRQENQPFQQCKVLGCGRIHRHPFQLSLRNETHPQGLIKAFPETCE
jgi:hypothetical protein